MRTFTAALVLRLVDRLSQPVRGAARAIGSVTAAQRMADDASRDWSAGLAELDERLGRLAQFSLVTEGLGRAGEAMMRPLRAATAAAADYEQELAQIGVTADLTADQLSNLDRAVMEASRFGRGPGAVAASAGTLVAGGLDEETTAGMLPTITQVVVGTGVADDDAARAAMGFNISLNVEPEEMERAFDAALTSAKAGLFELPAMAQYLPGLGAAANRRGMSGVGAVGEITAALSTINDRVMDEAATATYLRDLFMKMDAPQTTRAFEDFGVDVRAGLAEAQAAGQSPLDAIMDLTEQAMGRGAQLNELFTDQQAQLAIANLMDGRDAFEALREEASNASGVVEDSYRRMSRTTAGWIQQGEAAKERLGISVGTILAPALVLAAAALQKVADWMTKTTREGGWLAKAAVWAVAGFAALAVTAGALGHVIIGVLGPFLILRAVFGTLGRSAVVGMFARLAGVIGKARGAMIGFNIAMLANPVGLAVAGIVLAIGALALVVRKYWQPISAFFSGMGEVIGEALAPLGAMLAPLAPIWNAITGAVGAFFGWIGRLLQPVQMTGEQLEGATDAGRTFGRHLVTAFKIVTLPLQVMVAAVRLGIAAVRAVMAWNPMDTLRAAWSGISGFFGGLTDRFAGFGRAIIQGLINGIRSMLGGVRDAVMNTASSAVNWFRSRLGIRSPSRVFAALGDDTMAGLAMGLTRGSSMPLAALAGVAAALASTEMSAPTPVISSPPPSAPSAAAIGDQPARAAGVVIERMENHYHINGAQDVRAIAREIARLERQGLRSALNDAVNE